MDKPVSVAIADLKRDLTDLVVKSGLTPVVALPVIRDVCNLTAECARQQIESEKEAYEKYLKSQEG